MLPTGSKISYLDGYIIIRTIKKGGSITNTKLIIDNNPQKTSVVKIAYFEDKTRNEIVKSI